MLRLDGKIMEEKMKDIRIFLVACAVVAGLNCANGSGGSIDPQTQTKIDSILVEKIQNGDVVIVPIDNNEPSVLRKANGYNLTGEMRWKSIRAELEYINELIGLGLPYTDSGYIEAREAQIGEKVVTNFHYDQSIQTKTLDGMKQAYKTARITDAQGLYTFVSAQEFCLGGPNQITGLLCTTYSAALGYMAFEHYRWFSYAKYLRIHLKQTFQCCGVKTGILTSGLKAGLLYYDYNYSNTGGTHRMDAQYEVWYGNYTEPPTNTYYAKKSWFNFYYDAY